MYSSEVKRLTFRFAVDMADQEQTNTKSPLTE